MMRGMPVWLLAYSAHCMPYLDSGALQPASVRKWLIDARYEETNECPAGQRTARREECLSAVQEAAARESVEVNTVKFVDQGAGESVPAGCSYNVETKEAAFNKNPAGKSGKPWNNKLVCVDDVAVELAVTDWTPSGKPFQCHSRPHCDLGSARVEPKLSGAFEIAANKSTHYSKSNGCRVVTYTVALLDPEHKRSKASSPPPGSEGCAFAFVHNVSDIHPATSSGTQWMPIVVPTEDLPWPVAAARRNARVPKLLPHLFFPESVEATVFVDADSSLKIKRGIAGIVQNMLTDCGASFAALAHATRFTDVMAEFDDLRSSGTVADPANLDMQEHVYRADEDYMAAVDSGRAVAVDGQLLVRRNANPQSRHLDVAWMRAFVRGADRDLPAFSYALEKSGLAQCRARIGEEGYGKGRCGLGCGQGAINLVGSPRSADCLGEGVTEYCTDQPEGTWGRCSKVKARPSWATEPPPWVCNAITDKAGVGVGDASADARATEAPAPEAPAHASTPADKPPLDASGAPTDDAYANAPGPDDATATATAPGKAAADASTPANKTPSDASGGPADDAYANAPGPDDAPATATAPATGGPSEVAPRPSEVASSEVAPSGVAQVLPPLVAPGAAEGAAAGAEAAAATAAARAVEENMQKAAAIAKAHADKIKTEQENERRAMEKQQKALKDMEALKENRLGNRQQQQQQQQGGRTEEQQAAAQRIGGGEQSWPAPQQQEEPQQPPVEKMAVSPSGVADAEVPVKVVPLISPEDAAAAAEAKVAEANAAAVAAGVEAAAAAEQEESKRLAKEAAADAAKEKQRQQQAAAAVAPAVAPAAAPAGQTAAPAVPAVPAVPEAPTVPAPNFSNWPEEAAKAAAKAAQGDAAAAAAAADARDKAVAEAAAAAKEAEEKKAADVAANVARGEALTKAAAEADEKKVAERDSEVEAAAKEAAAVAAEKASEQKEKEKSGCVDWCYGEEHADTPWSVRCAWESGERGGCHSCPPCQKDLPAHPA